MLPLFFVWFQLLHSHLCITILASSLSGISSLIAKPGCTDHCGDVLIPYPFGIGPNCFHDLWYEIVCNSSFQPPKPFLNQLDFEVVDINWNGRYRNQTLTLQHEASQEQQTLKIIMAPQNMCVGDSMKPIDIRKSPYRFRTKDNVLLVEGCSGSVLVTDGLHDILAKCDSFCSGNVSHQLMRTTHRNCRNGSGCCLAPISMQVTTFGFLEMSLNDRRAPLLKACNMVATLIDNTSAHNYAVGVSTLDQLHPTTLLRWSASFLSTFSYDNVTCVGSSKLQTCLCNFPYEGNPCLANGCQVAKECKECKDRCLISISGAYYCKKNPLAKLVGILGGIIGFLLFCCIILRCLCLCLKKRRLNKMKGRLFQKNGGLLLKQQLPLSQGRGNDQTRIFTSNELKSATKNFCKDNILGKGGYGTVYKGFIRDQAVAIKRSEIGGEMQVEQFINEVVILTQVSHRNVVKLLGCCLETEIPLLVYEFVSNGNLYDHIHSIGHGNSTWLSWENCLRIATEAADAFAYLHSATSIPIIHRDIKSSNILLDENFRTKVSDFGGSRLIPMDQTQVTTLVQGTLGYLDPEYFQTSHLSEKSDVYSFGVVLAELLTRRKPIIWERGLKERNLATHFLSAMKQNELFSIFEPRLVLEATSEQLVTIAKLVEQCLSLKGEDRPSMKDVARELEDLKKNNEKDKRGEEKNNVSGDIEELKGYHSVPLEEANSSGLFSMEKESIIEMNCPR